MDPQKLSQLDPKLREAYERVMGTAIPQPQPQPEQEPTPTPTLAPAGEPSPIIEAPAAPIESKPASSVSQSIAEPQPAATNPQPQFISTPQPIPNQPASNFTHMNSEAPAPAKAVTPNFTAPSPTSQPVVLKKKRGIMTPILFGITGLIFIVIYTLFWTKIFNFKLPFLP